MERSVERARLENPGQNLMRARDAILVSRDSLALPDEFDDGPNMILNEFLAAGIDWDYWTSHATRALATRPTHFFTLATRLADTHNVCRLPEDAAKGRYEVLSKFARRTMNICAFGISWPVLGLEGAVGYIAAVNQQEEVRRVAVAALDEAARAMAFHDGDRALAMMRLSLCFDHFVAVIRYAGQRLQLYPCPLH